MLINGYRSGENERDACKHPTLTTQAARRACVRSTEQPQFTKGASDEREICKKTITKMRPFPGYFL